MSKMLGNLIKNNTDIDDKLLAESMLSAAKESADLYLNSTLTSTTPELRAIYSAGVVQAIEGHTALTEICVNKEWLKPYSMPDEQLGCAFNCSKDAMCDEA